MRSLLDVFRPEVLDENGRFSVRVTLMAADDEFQQILRDVKKVVTPDTRARLALLGPATDLAA